jgi:hypothetical protein
MIHWTNTTQVLEQVETLTPELAARRVVEALTLAQDHRVYRDAVVRSLDAQTSVHGLAVERALSEAKAGRIKRILHALVGFDLETKETVFADPTTKAEFSRRPMSPSEVDACRDLSTSAPARNT